MNQVYLQLPARLIAGVDTSAKLGELVSLIGNRAVFLVANEIRQNPQTKVLYDSLQRANINFIDFDDLSSTSGLDQIQTILQKSRASKPQTIIAAGSLRTLSLARLIAALTPSRISLERFLVGEAPTEKSLPVISIAASGRDPFAGSPFIFLAERFVNKPVIIHQKDNPVFACIFDPKLLQAIPPKQLSFLISDHLLMAFESLISSTANPLSEVNAKSALQHGAHALRQVGTASKDLKAAIEFCAGACAETVAISTSGLGPGYAAVAAINSRFGIPKAWVAAVLLPHVIEHFGSHHAAKLVEFAQALGEDTDTIALDSLPSRIASALRRVIAKLEQPARLRDFKLNLDSLHEIAELSLELEFAKQAHTPVHQNQMLELLRKAF